jgi:hypothetical protein
MKSSTLLTSACFSLPLNVFALCVVPPPPCQWYAAHHGQPTFIGVVTAEEAVPDEIDFGGRITHTMVQKTTFNIEEAFDGAPTKIATVYGEGTTDDFHFKLGERYLVYGLREKNGKIRTSKCTRTVPASEATDDISFLHSLPTQVGGEIYGVVRFVSPGPQTGTVEGRIVESGKDGDHQTRVLSSGDYELKGLVPGDYQETFAPDDGSTQYVSLKLSIPLNGSCAESGVRLGDLAVSGNVIDENGKPVPNSDVFLFYALDGEYHPDVLLRTRTDSLGRFNFDRVETAKYILAAQASRSGTIFFPGTRDPSKTDVIEVRESTPLTGLSIRIPSVSPTR